MPEQVSDSLIARAKFDNKHFDKNLKASQKSLDDFKDGFNFKSVMEQMNKFSQGMEQMVKNTSALVTKMTGIGKISDYVKDKILGYRKAIIDSFESMGKELTIVQSKAGFEKYNSLLSSVQTIMNATGETEEQVYAAMEKLNKYTDETSYSFSDMADNIGKFTTAGINLSDAEVEMEGIANWAALAGQTATEASRAMYNISQAMSAGSMKLVDYKSIQNANMDIREFRKQALEAAVAVGTLVEKNGQFYTKKGNKNVTLDNFTETLQYAWFDRATMEKVFKVFADGESEIGKKAFAAAQRCTKFNDVLDAIKDMLSSGWLETYEHVFGRLTDAMNLFSGLCIKVSDTLAMFMDTRNKIMKNWEQEGGRNTLWAAIVGQLETPDGDVLYKDAFGLLDIFTTAGDMVYGAFRDFIRNFINAGNLKEYDENPDYVFAYLGGVLADFTQKIQQAINNIKGFLDEIPMGATESRFVMIQHIIEGILAIFTLIANFYGAAASFAGSLAEQLWPSVDAVLQLFSYIGQLMSGDTADAMKKNTLGNFFQSLAEKFKPLTSLINSIVIALVNLVGKFIEIAHQSGLFDLIGNAIMYVASGIESLFNSIKNSTFFQKISSAFTKFISEIPSDASKLSEFGKKIEDFFKKTQLFKDMGDIFGSDWLTKIKSKVKMAIKEIVGFFSFGGKKKEGESVAQGMADAITSDEESTSVIDKVKNFFTNLFTNISDAFASVADSRLVSSIKGIFSTDWVTLINGTIIPLINSLALLRWGGSAGKIGKGIKEFGKGITEIGGGIKEFATAVKEGGLKGIFSFTNSITNSVTNEQAKQPSQFGKNLLQFAIGIGIIVFAALKLSEAISTNPTELAIAGGAIVGIMVVLAAASAAAKKWGGGGEDIMKLAIAVGVLYLALKWLGGVSWLGAGGFFDSMAKVMIMLLGLGATAKFIGGNATLKGFVGLSVAVGILVAVVRELGRMDEGIAWSGISRIAVIFALLAGLVAVAGATKFEGLKGMMGLGIAVGILSLIVGYIGNMPWQKALQGVIGVGLLIGAITAFVYFTKDAEHVGKLAGLVGAVTALTVVAVIVGQMRWDKALVGFGSIGLIMLSIALILRSTSKVKDSKMKSLSKIFTSMVVIVGLAAVAIGVLSAMGVKWEFVASFFGGLALLIAAMAWAIPALGKLSIPQLIQGVIGLSAAFAAIVSIFGALAPWIGSQIGSGIQNAIEKFVNIGSTIKKVIDGINGVGESSITTAGVRIEKTYAAISKLGGFRQLRGDVDSFTTQIYVLASTLRSAFRNESTIPDPNKSPTIKMLDKLRGYGSSLSRVSFGSLPDGLYLMGVALNLFAGLTSSIQDDNPPALRMLTALSDKQRNIEGLAKMDLTGLGGKLTTLAGGMSLFVDSANAMAGDGTTTTPITDEQVGAAVAILNAVCKALADDDSLKNFEIPANMPKQQELGVFGGQLAALGSAMAKFVQGCKGAGKDTTEATNALDVLAQVNHKLTADKLKVAKVFPLAGVSDTLLGSFALCIEALGGALDTFGTKIKNHDFGPGISALQDLATINNELTTDRINHIKAFTNNPNADPDVLGSFATSIEALGGALGGFAAAVNYVTVDGEVDTTKLNNFDNAMKAVETFAKISENLNPTGGLIELVMGHQTTLGELGTQVEQLGTNLVRFSDLVNGLPTESGQVSNGFILSVKLQNALDVLNTIIRMFVINPNQPNAALVSYSGTVKGFFSGYTKGISDIGDEVANLGVSLLKFSNVLNGKASNAGDGELSKITGNTGFEYSAKVKAALNVLDRIVKIKPKYTQEDINPILEFIGLQKTNLELLSEDMITLGNAISDFMTKVGTLESTENVNLDVVYTTLELVEKLLNIAQLLKVENKDGKYEFGAKALIDELVNFFGLFNMRDAYSGEKGITLFSDDLAEFARRLSESFNAVEDIDGDAITTFKDLVTGLVGLSTLSSMSEELQLPGIKIAEGIADGMLNNQFVISEAVNEIIAAIYTAMNDEDNEIQLTVTPVIDWTQVRTGGQLDYILKYPQLNSQASLRSAIGSFNNNVVHVDNPTDIYPILVAFETTQAKIEALGTAISQMQIVLDTNVVAGSVSGQVDYNIGQNGNYAGRRNAAPVWGKGGVGR